MAVAVEEIVFWFQHETVRLPGVSQTGFFFNVALVGLIGVVQAWLALRPQDSRRGPALIAIAVYLILVGSISGGAGSTRAIWFVDAGLLGLPAAVAALLETPRPWRTAVVGIVAAIPVFVVLVAASILVGNLFP
jgi:hypothetical protein